MSDPITPKADRRIIDGEVVNETIGKQARKAATAKTSGADSHSNKQQADTGLSWRQRISDVIATTKNYAMIFVIALFVIILWIALSKQNNQDWQIQKINELQTQVGQLANTTQALKTEQARLESLLAEQVAQQSEQASLLSTPLLSDTEIQAIKEQLTQVQARLTELGSDYGSQLQTLSSELSAALEKGIDQGVNEGKAQASKLLAPEAIQGLENQVEEKLSEMGSQISDLFAFQNELLAQKQDLQAQALEEAPAEIAVLSAMKMQQWVLDINGQWVLTGDVAQTQQQLLALEQALGLSEAPKKMALIRAIGEDLNRLENAVNQTEQDTSASMRELKDWLLALQTSPAYGANAPNAQSNSEASAASSNEVLTAESNPEASEPLQDSDPSSFDRLKGALTGLLSIQKRSDPEALNSVEKSLLSEVVKQRALLLIDKMNWAVTLKSEAQLERAMAEFETFMLAQYELSAAQIQQMKSLLAPLNQVEWSTRTPLKIMGVL